MNIYLVTFYEDEIFLFFLDYLIILCVMVAMPPVANCTLYQANYWVGLVRTATGFEWTDGSPYDFEFWLDGEPNGYLGGEDCIEVPTT
jgi:hypothetical protein